MKEGKHMNQVLMGTIALSVLAAGSAFADGGQMMANPSVNARPGVASGSVSRTGNLQVQLVNSCFATNLRAVSNPISPNSVVTATIPINSTPPGGGTPTTYTLWVAYPGAIVTPGGMAGEPTGEMSPQTFGSTPAIQGMTASLGGNIVQMNFQGQQVNIDPTGTQSTNTLSVGDMTFTQKMNDCNNTGPVYGSWGWSTTVPTYPCGSFMGKDGALTVRVGDISIATDSSSVVIPVSFPGQTGFCGGFYSPLMLFFDDHRPKFNGSSSFKLSAAGQTWWVEKGAPGFFLAIDRNGNGKIDGPEELFGNQDNGQNGFEALKELDTNHDGVIDAKDEGFSKLLLWQDKNGDGISQPGELEPAGKRIVKISLKYKNVAKSYGSQARAQQIGEFWYKDKKGKIKKGVIEDIWFAPINFTNKKK